MKDYRNKYEQKEENNYVLGYEVLDHDDVIVVNYAPTTEDKYLFNNDIRFAIPNTRENIDSLNFKMNEQMGQGIAEKAKFKLKRNASAAIAGASAFITLASTQFHNRLIAGVGVIALANIIYFGYQARKNSKKVEEIEKAEICREYTKEFKHLEDYPNALVGANKEFVEQLKKDPEFLVTTDDKYMYPTVNNFDKFLTEDVKKLKYNIELEKTIAESKTKKLVVAK